MNLRPVLLTVSLLANAGLLAAYLASPSAPATFAAAPRSTGPASGIAGTPSVPVAAAEQDAIATAAKARAKADFSWAAIDTKEIDELARRLKAAGFTPAEVRLILARRIAELSNPVPAGGAAKPTPYWRSPYRYEAPTGQNAEARRKQIAEQQRLFQKYVTGPDSLADDPERIASAKRQWGDLPLEKLQAIAAIESDYQDMNMKQYAERRYRPGEENNEAAAAARLLDKERIADIAKVLTPGEFAAYELRSSSIANSLHYQLETFKPTEEEYKTIFAINKAYEDRLRNQPLTLDTWKALNDEIAGKVKDALGADRALDYDAAVNQNSQDQTAGLVSRLGLPARVAAEVRQTQADFTQRAKDIRANTTLGLSDRSAQLEALAAQAQAQLTAKLGADGFEAYNDLKGEWLRNLKPKSGAGGP